MSRGTALNAARRAAEAGMHEACRIERLGIPTTNSTTGVTTQTRQLLYEGKCRVQTWSPLGGAAQPRTIGAQYIRILRLEIQLPIAGTAGLQDGDVVTLLTGVHDAELLNRTFTVRDLAFKSEASSRRIGVSEVQ